METERGHMSVRRGVSCSPVRGRKPFQSGDTETIHRKSDASWESQDDRGVKGQMTSASTNQLAWKTSLTRSASLSEKELKEARTRSQIIANQLTVPSGGSCSRGVQLFNRRRQRVNAFTLDSCGGGAGKDEEAEHADTRNNNLTWREGQGDDSETDRELNIKNNCRTKPPPWSPPSGGRIGSEVPGNDIMEEPGDEHIYEEVDVAQHRHFQPVKERGQDEKERDGERGREEIYDDAESGVKDGITPVNQNHNCTLQEDGGPTGWSYTEPAAPAETPNGFHITQGTMGKNQNGGPVFVSHSGQNHTIVNRTARPFFSPPTVQATATEGTSIPPAPYYPTPTVPPAPSYSTPPCQTFSPAPPPPSYPTPPLPSLPTQPVSSPNPVTPARATLVSQIGPPPTCPKPITFIPYIPQPIGQQFQQQPTKTGILEEGAAAIRRTSTARKSMFTFKEKAVVAPNPELLSLVQGNDERKKYGLRSVSDQPPDEELLALGAEASNFLAAEEVRAEAAKVPEWSSCLKSSRTREPRGQHQPEQTLTNVSGKGAELFAKRQSRMEKYVVENQNAPGGHMRSLSPTASLPPSWIYPSNMPGRVKAIVNNTDLNAQLARPLQTAQQVKRRPSQQAPAPEPVPEEPPLENGCTKIEMDLSRHRPYQLNPSLFVFNPVKDPTNTLPRGAPPPPRPLVSAGSFSSPPSNNYNSLPRCRPSQPPPSQCVTRGVGGGDYYPPQHRGTTEPSDPKIKSPFSAFSAEKAGSPRPGTQAPRPTFSAKRAGIEPQTRKESPSTPTLTPTRTPQFSRRLSSPEGAPSARVWSPSHQANQTPAESSRSPDTATSIASSPVTPAWETRCQSPAVVNQTTKPFSRVSSPRPTQASPVSPWGSRCQSPNTNQTTRPFSTATVSYLSASRPSNPGTITTPVSTSPLSSPWGSRPPSASDSKANHRLLAKNIINAAKRKNSPSPGSLSGHGLPISPLGGSATGQHHQSSKPPFSPYQPRGMGCRSPSFASPPPTPTGMIRSPVRLYNTRSLTDSDASVESEDSGLRSPGLHRSQNTCPRGWGGSLRIKRGSIGTDL